MRITDLFARIATVAAHACGRATTFAVALMSIVAWAAAGPLFGYSDTWQLAVNTTTTIITFLVVFLIQNSQNRETAAIHLKLDELIHATKGARDELMLAERLTDAKIESLHVPRTKP